MAGEEGFEAEKIATFQHLPTVFEKWGALPNNVEQDISVQKDPHAGSNAGKTGGRESSDTIFPPMMIHPDIVGGFAGIEFGDPRKSSGPRTGAPPFANRDARISGLRRCFARSLKQQFQAVGKDIRECTPLKSRTCLRLAKKVIRQFNGGPHAGSLAYCSFPPTPDE